MCVHTLDRCQKQTVITKARVKSINMSTMHSTESITELERRWVPVSEEPCCNKQWSEGRHKDVVNRGAEGAKAHPPPPDF